METFFVKIVSIVLHSNYGYPNENFEFFGGIVPDVWF